MDSKPIFKVLNSVIFINRESKEECHLKENPDMYLTEISSLIHEMYKSKNLERFLAKVFGKYPVWLTSTRMVLAGAFIMILLLLSKSVTGIEKYSGIAGMIITIPETICLFFTVLMRH